jgi:hypothetical protein
MRTVLPLVTAVLLLGGSDLRGDDAATIIRQAIKAHGGEENLNKLLMCQIASEGTIELLPDLPAEADITFKSEVTAKPGKFKGSTRIFMRILDSRQTLFSIGSVYNGEGQLVTNGKKQLLREAALKEFKATDHERLVCLLTPLLKDPNYVLTVLDEAKVSGKAVVGVLVHRKGNKDITLYFEKESGRLVKSKREFYHIGDKKDGELLTFYKDFKDVRGARVPHRLVVYQDGKQIMESRITRITILKEAPDSWFEIEE